MSSVSPSLLVCHANILLGSLHFSLVSESWSQKTTMHFGFPSGIMDCVSSVFFSSLSFHSTLPFHPVSFLMTQGKCSLIFCFWIYFSCESSTESYELNQFRYISLSLPTDDTHTCAFVSHCFPCSDSPILQMNLVLFPATLLLGWHTLVSYILFMENPGFLVWSFLTLLLSVLVFET